MDEALNRVVLFEQGAGRSRAARELRAGTRF
jgi:hypothetical protein